MMLVLRIGSFLLGKRIFIERVAFFTSIVNESIPVFVLLQALLVSYNEQEVFGTGDRYIHPSVVPKES